MGNTTSKITTESVMNVINKELVNINIKQIQKHSAGGSAIQRILGITKNGNVTISNVDMTSIVNISLDSYQKTMNKELLIQAVETSIDKYYDVQIKPSSMTLSSSNNEIVTTSKTNITNEIEKNITNEQISKCLASAYAVQEIKAETTTGNITIDIVNMKIVSTVSAECVSDLITDIVTKQINNIKIKEEINQKVEPKSIAESAFQIPDISSITTKTIPFMLTSIVGISCLSCLLLCCMIIFFVFLLKK